MCGVGTEGKVQNGENWEGTIHGVEVVEVEGKAHRGEGEGKVHGVEEEGRVHVEENQGGRAYGVEAGAEGGLAKLRERAHCHHLLAGEPSG